MEVKGLPLPQRYLFRVETEHPVLLPAYPGSMWRGLLGHGLRRSSCVTRQPVCAGCLLIESCIYNRVFESYSTDQGDARHSNRAHPYVLDISPAEHKPVSVSGFGITLLDQAQLTLPYIIHALNVAGELGIGRDKTRFALTGVEQETIVGRSDWRLIWQSGAATVQVEAPAMPDLPDPPDAVLITHETPLRIKSKGKLVGPSEFNAGHFLYALWRRSNDLHAYYHGECQVPFPLQKPKPVPVRNMRIRWQDWRRYSSRQKTAMNLGGLVGEWVFRDSLLEQWWPLLWHGQWLHLGKATSMGLGRYRVQPI